MDWSTLGEVTDWSDLSKMMDNDAGAGGTKPSKGNETKPGKGKAKQDQQQGSQDSKREPGKEHRERQHFHDAKSSTTEQQKMNLDNVAIGGWADMKQFDDDHDPDWFEEEENRLAKIYGGHFIKVKYTEQGRPGYFCELCVSEMNAKKSLESHCEGMKHLKKKALWEKNSKGGGDGNADSQRDDGRMGGWSDQGPSRGRGGGMKRDRSPLWKNSRDQRSPPNRRGPEELNDGRGRVGYNGHAGRGSRGPRDNIRGPRDDFRGPRDDLRGPRDDLRGPQDDFRGPQDNFRGPQDNFRGPPDDFRGPLNYNHGLPMGGRNERSPMPAPAPALPKEKLGGGTTGMLLTKLASCYIKDEEDANLALNVVSSLASSLREYNTKIGEKKIAELLMEAELKLNTLKALKVGLKILDKKQTLGSTAAAPAVYAAPPRSARPLTAPQASSNINPNTIPLGHRSGPPPTQWSNPGYQGYPPTPSPSMYHGGPGQSQMMYNQ